MRGIILEKLLFTVIIINIGWIEKDRSKIRYLTCSVEKTIDKLATGGNRSRYVHIDSIGTIKGESVNGDIVLLMDDVTTTGNSLYACKEILLAHGAKTVEMFALGKAI